MKKYKLLICGIVATYIILAVGLYFGMKQNAQKEDSLFRVEINEISQRLQPILIKEDEAAFQNACKGQLKEAKQVESITFLKAEISDYETLDAFYTPTNRKQFEILPVYEEETLIGYLRFDYEKKLNQSIYMLIAQASLAILFVVVLIILVYIDRNIIHPFISMKEMPYELSKGNFSGEIKATKNRFLGQFLWGVNMLKDTLEYHKDRELKLARDKKMLLLSISHDIKTPINAINLYATGILKGMYKTEDEIKESAKHIQEKTKEIDAYVKEIVRSSTEDVVAIEVKKGEFYIKDLVEKIRNAYQEKCNIRKMEFTIGTYENHLIVGDIDRIYEALCNLIENAFKYGDGRKLALSFSEEENCLLISVYNSGTPVTNEDIPHLFDSFYRGKNSKGQQGNGLGLYICHEIMKKSGGDIFANQKEDGMEFVLVLEE